MHKIFFIFKIFFVCLCSSATFAEEVNIISSDGIQTGVNKALKSQSATEQPLTTKVDASKFCGKDYSQEKLSLNNNDWVPSAVEHDWVKLSSNEWLRGEIKSMYQKKLEFDSDKLKLLSIKWKDVKILRSYRESSINIDKYGDVYGILEITEQVVNIHNDYETLTFDRSQLISFVPGGEKETDLWVIKITLGLDIRQGNTNQWEYNAKLNIKRRASKLRFELDYIGFISKTNGVNDQLTETVNNHRITAFLDYYKTRYFFYNPVFVELFRDPFLNIELRATLGTGLGYSVIDDGKTELSFSGGPAYVNTEFISVAAGEKSSRSTGALLLRSYYKTDFTNTLDFITKYNIQYTDEASGGYSHHAIATFKEEIRGELDFDVSLIWDRLSNPAEDASGNVPESDDFRMTIGLSYTY